MFQEAVPNGQPLFLFLERYCDGREKQKNYCQPSAEESLLLSNIINRPTIG